MLRRNLGHPLRLGKWATFMVVFAAIAVVGDAQPAKTDQAGDPLPAGALARMGTLRWRHSEAVSFVAFTSAGKGVLTAASDNTIRLWDRETGKEIRRFGSAAPQGQPIGAQPGAMIAWTTVGRGLNRLALSHDGKILATILANNSIQLWNVETGKEIRQIKTPTFVYTLLFAPDGKSIAARGQDRTIYLMETDTGKEIRQIKREQPNDGKNRIFIGGMGNGNDGLAFSHNGKTIACSEMEFANQKVTSLIRLVDTETGKEMRQIDVGQTGVSAVAFSPDGKVLAFGNGFGVHLREADSGKEVRQIVNPAFVAGLAFAPDSNTLAVKGRDQVIWLYETYTGKKIRSLGDAPANLGVNVAFAGVGMAESNSFAFSPDGKIIAAGGAQSVRFFNVATGKEQAAQGGHRGAVSALVITPDGKTMISRGADNVIRRWNTADGKETNQFHEPSGSTGATFSRDGTLAAFGKTDGSVRLIDVTSGKELYSFRGHPSGVAAVAFSPDGKILASRGYSDDKIFLHDTAKGGDLRELTIPGATPAGGGGFVVRGGYGAGGLGLVFSPDGQTLAANLNANNFMIRGGGGAPQPAGEGNAIRMWDVSTGKEIRKIALPAQRIITNLAYSPDGRLLATENSDQTLSLWEIASGKERALLGTPAGAGLPGQPSAIAGGGFRVIGRATSNATTASLAFSPDGSLLATRGTDNTVRVWEVSYAKEVGSFKGHEGAVNAVAFAPDGKSLASASADTTLLVWDLARLKREPKANVVELQAKEVETLWADLLGDDAAKAARSIQTLAAGSKQATALMRDKLKPATPPDVKMIDQWIAELDSSNFGKRTKASLELEKMGELAVPALRKILDSKPSPETRRRVEPILEKLTTGVLSAEQIRLVRAIESLEKMANTEARQVLETLAGGAPGALSTRQAQAALSRLGKS